MKFMKGKPGHCFHNTFVAVMEDRSLTYVEGYLFPHHIHHAWAIKPDGEIVECTLSPVEAKKYLYKPGIAFSREEISKRLSEGNRMLPLMTCEELQMLDISLGVKYEVFGPGPDGEWVPLPEGVTPSRYFRERLISGENERKEKKEAA